MSIFTRRVVLCTSAITAAASASRAQADILTWLDRYDSIDASWSGGVAIGGQSSWSDHRDSGANPPAGYQVLSPNGRMTFGLSTTFYADPNPAPPMGTNIGGLDDNNTINYDGNFAPGVPDSSIRSFGMQVSKRYVFNVSQDVNLWTQYAPFEQLATWTPCEIQPGVYLAGVFTPVGSPIDLNTFPVNAFSLLPAGDYMYRSSFTAGFDADSGFYSGNGAMWRVFAIPSPSGIGAFVGVIGWAVRRRVRLPA